MKRSSTQLGTGPLDWQDLPSDIHNLFFAACTPTAFVCLAFTCRAMFALSRKHVNERHTAIFSHAAAIEGGTMLDPLTIQVEMQLTGQYGASGRFLRLSD